VIDLSWSEQKAPEEEENYQSKKASKMEAPKKKKSLSRNHGYT